MTKIQIEDIAELLEDFTAVSHWIVDRESLVCIRGSRQYNALYISQKFLKCFKPYERKKSKYYKVHITDCWMNKYIVEW